MGEEVELVSCRVRHCIECSSCGTRYLIAANPYQNGSCLLARGRDDSEEYTLYCSCSRPPALSHLRAKDVKRYEVTRRAYHRGYGSSDEIFPYPIERTGWSLALGGRPNWVDVEDKQNRDDE